MDDGPACALDGPMEPRKTCEKITPNRWFIEFQGGDREKHLLSTQDGRVIDWRNEVV
jgi:hypothetical protein